MASSGFCYNKRHVLFPNIKIIWHSNFEQRPICLQRLEQDDDQATLYILQICIIYALNIDPFKLCDVNKFRKVPRLKIDKIIISYCVAFCLVSILKKNFRQKRS